MTSKLGDVLLQAAGREPRGEAGAERLPRAALVANGVGEDLADLFRGAAPMTASAALEPRLHFVVEVANQELSHRLQTIA